jgi:hypothetical protein
MPTRSLPTRPNLDQLKRQAQELRRSHGEGKRAAAARIAAHHPRFKSRSLTTILNTRVTVADAQLVIAREYGFGNWSHLKQFVATAGRVAKYRPHPRFDEAVAAIDHGDVDRLRDLLAADPSLVHARTNLAPPYHYFTGATLLNHIAGNPDRGRLAGTLPPLPKNMVEIVRALLEAGADVSASTLGPNGGTTMGLLLTSKLASEANLSGPLIDVLLEYGAKRFDFGRPDTLDGPLANHAPRAAEKLIDLGAKPDLLAAAGLGRMEWLRAMFDDDRFLGKVRRNGKVMSGRDAIGLAALYAYVRGQRQAVECLLTKDGNWNMVGVNNGTIMHRAAWDGDLPMIERLVANGADVNDRNNPFVATPIGWAHYNHQTAVVQWMAAHCALDIHEAVCFDLRDQVEARLREQPDSVNKRIDHLTIPRATPLHCAAKYDCADLAELLIERGAKPNSLAGNGQTPLDTANAENAVQVAGVLIRHGGKLAATL